MPRRRRAAFLVSRGRMTVGEKRALANFYLTWGPKGVGLTKLRKQVDRDYPYTRKDVEKLIRRGLMTLTEVTRSGDVVTIDITPQGTAVARMILGLTKRRRRRKGT